MDMLNKIFQIWFVSNNQGKHAQFQLGWNLRVRDLAGIFKSYIAASFNSVLYLLQITVSVWPVRIEGDKKLFRPLRSNQLQESRVKQTVAGAQAQMHSSTFSTTIT